jgi:hypothetical protein
VGAFCAEPRGAALLLPLFDDGDIQIKAEGKLAAVPLLAQSGQIRQCHVRESREISNVVEMQVRWQRNDRQSR